MSEIIGFRLTLDTAEEFFKRCMERKAETKAERIAILEELKAECLGIAVTEKDLSLLLKGKKVLEIKRREDEEI